MALIALYIYVCALSHVKCYSFAVDVYTHEMTMFSFFGIAFVVFCLVLSCFHTFSVRLILFSASSGDFNQMLDMSVRESVLVLIYARLSLVMYMFSYVCVCGSENVTMSPDHFG